MEQTLGVARSLVDKYNKPILVGNMAEEHTKTDLDSSGSIGSSKLKTTETSGSVGIANRFSNDLVLLGLVEYGKSSYDSSGSSNSSVISSKGSNSFVGTALLVHWSIDKILPSKDDFSVYFDAGLRFGSLTSNYALELDSSEVGSSQESKSSYYSVMVGTGTVFQIARKITLDIFGGFQQLHLDETTAKIANGGNLNLDATDTNSLALGTRGRYYFNRNLVGYAEVVADYQTGEEIDGAVKNNNGTRTSLNDIATEGLTTREEIGLEVKLGRSSPFNNEKTLAKKLLTIIFSVDGQQGLRRSFGGGVGIRGEW
jgi:hypothetical protein